MAPGEELGFQGELLIGYVNLAFYSNSSCLSFPSSDMVMKLVVFSHMINVGVKREHTPNTELVHEERCERLNHCLYS